ACMPPRRATGTRDGTVCRSGALFGGRRTVVRCGKGPPIVVDAFVAAEDNSFWTHSGVDYWGMFRALVMNLRAGHTTQGASTITQQVVKNLLLTPERTFKRKIQEIILARRLEKSLSKEEIMTLYLNQIYFGAGRYGVEEAARFYFGKDISKVNIGEAALLAALPKDPQPLSHALRDQNPQRARRAKDRQIYVLNQLAAMHKITDAEAQKWADAPIQIVKSQEANLAPEWVEFARKELLRQHGGDEAALDTLGATVRTTRDSSLQAIAQKALQNGLRAVDRRHGIGRPVRTVKPDKVSAEIARLAKKLPRSGPAPKESYDAVVTEVSDDDRELAVDLGDWKAAVVLGGEDDARFNPEDADGKTRKPSERFKVGDVVSVILPPATKSDDDDDDARAKKSTPRHAKRRVVFSPGPEGA